MRFNEDGLEDELDRLRARRQKKKYKNTEKDDDFSIYDDIDDMDPDGESEPDEEDDDNGIGLILDERPDERREEKRTRQTTMRGRGPAPRRPKKKKKKHLLLKLLLVIAVLLACRMAYQRVRDDGYWTVAVFGVDSRDGNLGKGALSDVEMLCSINKKTGEMRLVSVFRDTYLRIDSDGTYHKINEAYFKGGNKQAVQALKDNLDLQIDDYATFNWKAVVDAINVLGGVDLEITDKEFAYINAFITETVNSTGVGSYQLEHSGMNHLDGVQAVAYARLRLMDTDFNRTERQRKVLQLAMDKAKTADFKTLKTLVGAVYPQVSTSIGVDDLVGMAKNARKYYIGQTSGFPFSHTEMKIGKMDCVIPATLESNVVQLHQFLYDVGSYTPSGQVRKISSHISEKSGIGDPGEDIESGRTSGGGSSDGGSKKKPAATDPAPTETLPTETESTAESESASETAESSSEEETTIEALESPEEGTADSESESEGPGVPTTEPPEPDTQPAHTTEAPPVTEPEAEEEPKTTGALEAPGQNDGPGTGNADQGPGV